MSILKKCPLYRDFEILSMGPGVGNCDLDCSRTHCKGEMYSCERYDVLRKYLLDRKGKEGDLTWEKR